MGGQTYFLSTPSVSTLFEDLERVRPTEIVLPPRICALLYEKFNEELGALQQRASGADIAGLREVCCLRVKSHVKRVRQGLLLCLEIPSQHENCGAVGLMACKLRYPGEW